MHSVIITFVGALWKTDERTKSTKTRTDLCCLCVHFFKINSRGEVIDIQDVASFPMLMCNPYRNTNRVDAHFRHVNV